MIHEIKNQLGNYIIDEDVRTEINHALDHALTHTYYKGIKIEIVKDKKYSKERVTLVKIEGI